MRFSDIVRILCFLRIAIGQEVQIPVLGYIPGSVYDPFDPNEKNLTKAITFNKTSSWKVLSPTDGKKFTPRNCHATTVFISSAGEPRLYLSGGKTEKYPMWNLDDSFKANDVWSSIDGATWRPVQPPQALNTSIPSYIRHSFHLHYSYCRNKTMETSSHRY